MNYYVADIKKLYGNKLVQLMLITLLIISILDPLTTYYFNGSHPSFFQDIGKQPFQYWLLMNSSGWGNAVFIRLILIFPVISTGLIYFQERNSSITEFFITRTCKKKYYSSKIMTVFFTTFINFFAILTLNLIVTYLLFDINSPKTDVYFSLLPKHDTFAMYFFEISPFLMCIMYTFLNALAQAIFSVLILSIQMIYRFRNSILAFIVPFGILFATNYLCGLFLNLEHNLRVIIQPRAASAVVNLITPMDVIVTFTIIVLIASVLIVLGFRRNRDIL